MVLAYLERAVVDRRAVTCFQIAVHFFSVNDMAHFESDIMPSKGVSMISEGGLVPYEIVILTGGSKIISEGGIVPL